MKAAKKAQVHQLTDMEIHEVSLVDHAANKRRFLIAKMEDRLPENEDNENTPPATAVAPPEPADGSASPPAHAQASETNELLRELLVALREGSVATLKAINDDTQRQEVAKQAGENEALERSLNERLARLEKHFGLPNSEQPDQPPRRRKAVGSWPFDINRPGDEDEGSGFQ